MRTVLLIPVYHKKIEAHANYTVNDFNTVQDFLYCIVESEIANFDVTLFLILIFIYSFEIAVVEHCHGAMAVSVPTVTVEAVGGILQPVVTLLFQKVLIHENMVKHNDNLKNLECIKHFAKVKHFLPQNKITFCKYHYRNYGGLNRILNGNNPRIILFVINHF